MKYKDIITLVKNNRGCYILDTVKGCSYTKTAPGGCYGDCYAANIAKRYGKSFGDPVNRKFDEDKQQIYFEGFSDVKHEAYLVKQINKIDMPFVRIGEMGDPSENWEHTIDICSKIVLAGKPIVIITKHWGTLSELQLGKLKEYNVIVNTSISALDSQAQIKHRLEQYNRLKPFCKSILRVVTCDFSTGEAVSIHLDLIQDDLLKNDNVIETVFRPSPKNNLVTDNVINTSEEMFIKSEVLTSIRDKSTYIGHCSNCDDMCGVNINKEAL